jgi:TRAP-type C4-dicarboxylate transport system permease small subunit
MSTRLEQREVRGAAVPPLAGLTAALDRWTCRACIALFMAILVTMVFQVTFRYVLNAPLVWTEELARYLFIWSCYLGAPVALRRGNHVTIVFVSERLPRGLARAVAIGCQALSLLFFLQLAVQGSMLALRSHTVEAITLPIPWSVIYAVAPVSAILMILETIRAMWLGPVPSSEGVQA